MRNLWWKLVLCVGWSALALGATETENAFSIDPNLLSEIYEDSAEATSSSRAATLEISPTAGVFIPSQLTLTNEYFAVPYASNVSSLPAVSVTVGYGVEEWRYFSLRAELSLGYGYVEGLYQIQNLSGSSRQSLIRLHRLPALLAARTTFTGFSRIRPFLTVGGGAQWLYQDGLLDGLSRGFWIPQVRVQPGLQFIFGGPKDTFQGLTLGVAWDKSIASSQQLEGWSVDASVDFLL